MKPSSLRYSVITLILMLIFAKSMDSVHARKDTPAGMNRAFLTQTAGPSNTPTATRTPTATVTPVYANTGDYLGVYKNGWWYLSDSAIAPFQFGGDPADLPVTGDWNGDSIDTVGVYRSSSGFFFLINYITPPSAPLTVLLGNPGDMPLAGKWAADMSHDGLGVFRPTNGIIYEKRDLASGFSDYFAIFGNPGDVAIVGDWDKNSVDSLGVYRASEQHWYLTNNGTPSGITFSDYDFTWDIGGAKPFALKNYVGYYTSDSHFSWHTLTSPNLVFERFYGPGGSDSWPLMGAWPIIGDDRPAYLSGVIVNQNQNGNPVIPNGSGD